MRKKTSKRFQKRHRLKLWADYAFGGVNKKNMSFEWYLENCTGGYSSNKTMRQLIKQIQNLW